MARVVAVDRNRAMELAHFKLASNLSFHEIDLMSSAAADWLADVEAEARTREAPLLVVGVHLCGLLCLRATSLFSRLAAPAAMVLVPCCLDKRLTAVKNTARRLHIDPYTYWCLTLLFSVQCSRRELLLDDEVLSERNSFLLSVRL